MGFSELAPGTVLRGKYEIDRTYAKGGMSTIYLGHILNGAAQIIVKQLDPPSADTDIVENVRQFEAEYRILGMLDHPGLPHVLDFFEEENRHYIVEEYIYGDTLQKRIETLGRLDVAEAATCALSLLQVLEYLHARRIVYRDVTASNVLLARDDRVRLIDFGAARFWREGAPRDTVLLGTPGYTPPEQWGTAQTDERSDLYSVGALLHFMLTGEDPQQSPPWSFRPPHEVRDDLPRPFSQITMKALQNDPAERFPNATAMREAIVALGLHDRGPNGRPRMLLTLRRRLRYTQPQDYYRVIETLSVGLFGVFFFAVSVPAWFANVPLPHPLVGMWLTAYAFMNPYSNYKRLRGLTVEIYQEGLRIESDETRHEVLFDDVVKLRLTTPGVATAHTADIYTRTDHVRFDGTWPGFGEVVADTIAGAELVERTPGVPWIYPIETNEKIYERSGSNP